MGITPFYLQWRKWWLSSWHSGCPSFRTTHYRFDKDGKIAEHGRGASRELIAQRDRISWSKQQFWRQHLAFTEKITGSTTTQRLGDIFLHIQLSGLKAEKSRLLQSSHWGVRWVNGCLSENEIPQIWWCWASCFSQNFSKIFKSAETQWDNYPPFSVTTKHKVIGTISPNVSPWFLVIGPFLLVIESIILIGTVYCL